MAVAMVEITHTPSQPDLAMAGSDFNFNDLASGLTNNNAFSMNDNIYNNSFGIGNMPMDLGTFTEAFNWVRPLSRSACEQGAGTG